MKINSTTIKLNKEAYEQLENIIKKVASDNNIEDVESVKIKLSEELGIVTFAFDIDENTAKKVMELVEKPAIHNEAANIMREINELIGGFGVEAIRQEGSHVDNYYFDIVATYINTGHTYSATIVHDSETGKFLFTTYGDYVEQRESQLPMKKIL